MIERQLLTTLPTNVLLAVGIFGLMLRCADAYLMKKSERSYSNFWLYIYIDMSLSHDTCLVPLHITMSTAAAGFK